MIVDENISIKEMLEVIDTSNTRITFLTNEKGQLTGCISQGDIIRALIDGASLKVQSKDIAELNPTFVEDSDRCLEEAKRVLLSNKIHAVPVVDSSKKIISIITLMDVLEANN